jgi:hypothetical protein
MEILIKLFNEPVALLFATGFILYAMARLLKYVFTTLSYFEDENNFPK